LELPKEALAVISKFPEEAMDVTNFLIKAEAHYLLEEYLSANNFLDKILISEKYDTTGDPTLLYDTARQLKQ